MAQVVPTKEKAAAAAGAQTTGAGGPSGGGDYENVIILDLDESSTGEGSAAPPGVPAPPSPTSPGPAAPHATAVAASPYPPEVPVATPAPTPPELADELVVPQDMVLLSRRTLFVQGALYFVVALAALLIGLAVRPDNPATETPQGETEPTGEALPMPIEGKILYDPGDGRFQGDAGAVVIALPAGKHPEKPLPADSLGPHDRLSPVGQRAVRAIQDLGGAYTRADREGRFFVTVPRQGTYRLLIVSASVNRPVRDTVMDPVDEMEIERYFNAAAQLVGRSKYRWTVEDVDPDLGKIDLPFGKTGEE